MAFINAATNPIQIPSVFGYSPIQDEAGRSESGHIAWARLQPSVMPILPGVPAAAVCVCNAENPVQQLLLRDMHPMTLPHQRQQM